MPGTQTGTRRRTVTVTSHGAVVLLPGGRRGWPPALAVTVTGIMIPGGSGADSEPQAAVSAAAGGAMRPRPS